MCDLGVSFTFHFRKKNTESSVIFLLNGVLGGKYLFFVSSGSVKMRGFSFLSLYKSVFIFQFLNVKMYDYEKQNNCEFYH